MNKSELRTLLDSDTVRNIQLGSSWTAKCVRRLNDTGNLTEIAAGVVGKGGQKLETNSTDAWGINIATCYANCSRQDFPMVLPSSFSERFNVLLYVQNCT